MGIEIVDLDHVFDHLKSPPVILNKQDILTEQGREAFNKMLFTEYGNEPLTSTPSCECGKIKARYKIGIVCTHCGTEVKEPINNNIEANVWMEPPKYIRKLMAPIAWQILTEKLTSSGYSYVRWMCDPDYRRPTNIPARLVWMLEQGHKRGYVYFLNNFKDVMRDLIFGDGRRKPAQVHLDLWDFIEMYEDRLFVKRVPIPSKVAFVIEQSDGGNWTDKTIILAIDAVRRMQETEQFIDTLSVRQVESRVSKILDKLGEFYKQYIKANWDGKEMIFRKHIFGARLHFTARGVITSLTDKHHKSELHLPWGLSLQLFKVHIASKLIGRGYSAEGAMHKINASAHRYDEELASIFQELVKESPYMGIPVLFQRNPTLKRGSAQLLFVTLIKTDPSDNTIGFSVMSLADANAD